MKILEAAGYCKACNQIFDLNDIFFINDEEAPIVLDVQMNDRYDSEEAVSKIELNFDYYEWDVDTELPEDKQLDIKSEQVYHYEKTPKLSHEEPGDDEHELAGFTGGYWSTE